MTNQQILEKAITKAIEGGWKHYLLRNVFKDQEANYLLESRDISDYDIIFNHQFAKALWGEEWEEVPIKQFNEAIAQDLRPYDYRTEGATVGNALHRTGNKGWERHLQAMVIADDPVKYLGDNI